MPLPPRSARPVSKNASGFTLIELMVVVAITGILATIATASYRTFMRKARQTEAKLALTGIFVAQKNFQAEQNSYTACIFQSGFEPTGGKRFYASGFYATGATNTCGPDGAGSCLVWNWRSDVPLVCECTIIVTMPDGGTRNDCGYFATATDDPNLTITAAMYGLPGLNPYVTQGTFKAVAAGFISSSGLPDAWSINDTKHLVNEVSGL